MQHTSGLGALHATNARKIHTFFIAHLGENDANVETNAKRRSCMTVHLGRRLHRLREMIDASTIDRPRKRVLPSATYGGNCSATRDG